LGAQLPFPFFSCFPQIRAFVVLFFFFCTRYGLEGPGSCRLIFPQRLIRAPLYFSGFNNLSPRSTALAPPFFLSEIEANPFGVPQVPFVPISRLQGLIVFSFSHRGLGTACFSPPLVWRNRKTLLVPPPTGQHPTPGFLSFFFSQVIPATALTKYPFLASPLLVRPNDGCFLLCRTD